MGNGRFKAGTFDLVAIANFLMTATDFTEWERCFKKVSEILYNASEGQMRFGNIFVCDDSNGIDSADIILYPSGDPSFSSGSFGSPGAAIHLMPYVKRRGPLTLLHEMGHYVWNLGDEYCEPYVYDRIDTTNPAPNRRTIPILNSGRANNELANQNAMALLPISGLLERNNIVADTATSITVDSDFSVLPTSADDDLVVIQIPAECSSVANSNYCIMEKSRDAAGYFDSAGTWQTVAHPVTEFCAVVNHDPDGDTAQQDSRGEACWGAIIDRAEFATLTVPNPASGVMPAGFSDPNWIVLDKQPRFVLVLDRSGSMLTGHKMADAQHGAVYWLEFCAEGNDLLAIIWYDNFLDRILNLTQVNTLPNLNNEINAINALTPRGTTNIREALYEALDQIQTPATRAAVQVTFLLTDGKHNTPSGSHASEVLPSFQEAGARIYTLGVGDASVVDMDMLDELAAETGGASYAVGDNQPGVVETAMVEINAEVRGGIITTNPLTFPDSKDSAIDGFLKQTGQGKHPPLKRIMDFLGVKTVKQLITGKRSINKRMKAIPVDVEEEMERVSFTIVYPEGQAFWLYLIDPDGNPVDMYSPPVNYVKSTAPHEFALVRRPMAGRWYMLALRISSGARTTIKAVAGGENKQLQVFGGAQNKNHAITPVRIWAKALYNELLSGLRVTARVVSPAGAVQQIQLEDNRLQEPMSGEYEGYCMVAQGRYHGLIKIENTGKAVAAKPARRLLDSEKGKVSPRVKAPRFVRIIPFYFDSGDRPAVKDIEREQGLTSRYEYIRPRKTKLVSAEKSAKA